MSITTLSPRLKRPGAIATVAGLALLAVPAMSMLSVADAALQTGCSQATRGANVVCTYDTAGAHTFVVPTGVTSVTVDLIGAKGGNGTGIGSVGGGTGGKGAEVKGALTVAAGDSIFVGVGANGATGGDGGAGGAGVSGGGNAGPITAGDHLGGGGGGATEIRTPMNTPADRKALAAGGGGGGSDGAAGGDAGGVTTAPGDGANAGAATGGGAATATTPGAAGTDSGSPTIGTTATGGTDGEGGNGTTVTGNTGFIGGGGGGGLKGGGGGGALAGTSITGAGGGGGWSLTPATWTQGTATTDPQVTISYAPGPATVMTFTMTTPIPIGTADPATVTETDANGATVTPGTMAFTLDPVDAGTCDATGCTFSKIGDVKVTGTDGALHSELTITVTHGPPTALTIDPATIQIQPDAPVTYTTHGVDAGTPPNSFDATSESTFVIAPTSGGSATGASCTANVCTAHALGTYSVTATDGPAGAAAPASAIATLEVVAAPTTTPTPTPTPTPTSTGTTGGGGGTNSKGGGNLANTGTAVENGIRYALALLALGAAVVTFARRRQLRIAHPFVQRPRDNPSIGFRLPPHTH